MRRHPFFLSVWIAVELLLVAALILLLVGVTWEYSTRRYLKGFADAVVPLSAPPEQKVEAILAWMQYGPARRAGASDAFLALRDPDETLNHRALLRVCGTATNAFINLAKSSGLEARRLLLLTPERQSKHVLAEVRLDNRWVVVDPAFHTLFRNVQGQFVTRQQLVDPRVFREVTQKIPNYPPNYTFERTAHVRLARLPVIGRPLRKILDTVVPGWEEAVNWTLILERKSLMLMLAALLLVCFSLACRFALNWYGERRLGIERARLRHQFLRAGEALFTGSR
jgi:hypothetical protein